MKRAASWIWRDRGVPFGSGFLGSAIDSALNANLFVRFRRIFSINGAQAAAKLRISADGRYLLYVNGTYVARGLGPLPAIVPVSRTADVVRRRTPTAEVHSLKFNGELQQFESDYEGRDGVQGMGPGHWKLEAIQVA